MYFHERAVIYFQCSALYTEQMIFFEFNMSRDKSCPEVFIDPSLFYSFDSCLLPPILQKKKKKHDNKIYFECDYSQDARDS